MVRDLATLPGGIWLRWGTLPVGPLTEDSRSLVWSTMWSSSYVASAIQGLSTD